MPQTRHNLPLSRDLLSAYIKAGAEHVRYNGKFPQVRLPAELLRELKKRCGPGQKHGSLIVEILQGWLSRGAPAPLGNLERFVEVFDQLVAIMCFADHALSREEFPWAIREYRRLQKVAERHRFRAISSYALYRDVYCNWALSTKLRDQLRWLAGTNPLDANNAAIAAEKVICRSIRLGESLLERERHAINLYNLAGCHSFYAALQVEKYHIRDEEYLRSLKEAPDGSKLWTNAPNSLARTWREKRLCEEDNVNTAANAAMKALNDLVSLFNVRESLNSSRAKRGNFDEYEEWAANCPVDRDWLIRETEVDSDFTFLHSDKDFGPEFTKWFNSAQQVDSELDRKPNKLDNLNNLLSAVEHLEQIFTDSDVDRGEVEWP